MLRARTAASRWSTMIHSRRFTPEEGEQSIHRDAEKVCWLVKSSKPSILVIAFPLQRLTVSESRGLAPLLLDRHVLLTIRNLTHCTDRFIECLAMNVITVRRTVFRSANKRSRGRRSFRELTRAYFTRENSLEFVLEALFFVISWRSQPGQSLQPQALCKSFSNAH